MYVLKYLRSKMPDSGFAGHRLLSARECAATTPCSLTRLLPSFQPQPLHVGGARGFSSGPVGCGGGARLCSFGAAAAAAAAAVSSASAAAAAFFAAAVVAELFLAAFLGPCSRGASSSAAAAAACFADAVFRVGPIAVIRERTVQLGGSLHASTTIYCDLVPLTAIYLH